MTSYNPALLRIETLADARQAIEAIGSDPQSVAIMAPKMVTKVIKFKNVRMQDAIIIKQDMLSVGGEVALPKEAFELKEKTADILIIGTLNQLTELVTKLNRHYARLQRFATELSLILENIV